MFLEAIAVVCLFMLLCASLCSLKFLMLITEVILHAFGKQEESRVKIVKACCMVYVFKAV